MGPIISTKNSAASRRAHAKLGYTSARAGLWLRLGQSRRKHVGELVDLRHGDVEPKALDVLGDGMERLVRRPPQFRRLRAEGLRHGRTLWRGLLRQFLDEAPDALDEPPGPLNAGFRPDHVALGRAIGQHEPAGAVGALSAR